MNRCFVHLELNTDSPEEARRFYRDVFSWGVNELDVGQATYTEFKLPEPPTAGMQRKSMPEAPAQWLPYIGVEDVRATLDRARAAGGEVVIDYTAVPGFGALGIVMDPTGAPIGLWETEQVLEIQPVGEPISVTEGPLPPAKKKAAKKKTAKKKTAKKKTAKKKTAAAKEAKPEEAKPVEAEPAAAPAKDAKKPAAKKKAAKKPAAKKKTSKKAVAVRLAQDIAQHLQGCDDRD